MFRFWRDLHSVYTFFALFFIYISGEKEKKRAKSLAVSGKIRTFVNRKLKLKDYD